MSELPTTLPDKDVYQELVEVATDVEDIKTLREMAQSDLASVAIKPENGESFQVTAIGAEKFSELNALDPKSVEAAMAIDSDSWHTEEK